jgi:hypothetical protein
MLSFGEGLEEIIRLAFRALNDSRGDNVTAEVIWADPEFKTQSELIDSLVKQRDLGVPDEILWEKAGYSPKEIERIKLLRQEEAIRELPEVEEPPVPVPAGAGGE